MKSNRVDTVKLKSFFADDKQSVNPSAFPNETFTLFSIPSYDTGHPETVSGSEVGSSKVLLKDGDVLLSRIVPHIRRCWIVNGIQKHRTIGSGEWIVFRLPKEINPKYLRYYLLTDFFGKNFLQTVRGVGGSLLRADPKQVGEFEIPVPSLPIQKSFVAILDKADGLRQKDKLLIDHYNQLGQSVFYNMFGDPATNTKKWKKMEFGSVVEFPSSLIDPTKLPYSKMLHVGGDNIATDGAIIGLKTAQELGLRSGKFLFDESHILYNKIRPYLNKVATPNFSGLCSADMYPLKPSKDITREFLYNILRCEDFLNFAAKQSRRANIPKINREELSSYKLIVPDLSLQKQFSGMFLTIQKNKAIAEESSSKSELLFQSFLQKAFNGELVKES